MRPLDGDAEDQCYQNIDDKLKLSGIQSRTKWRTAMSWQLVPTIQQHMLLAYFHAVLVPKKKLAMTCEILLLVSFSELNLIKLILAEADFRYIARILMAIISVCAGVCRCPLVFRAEEVAICHVVLSHNKLTEKCCNFSATYLSPATFF